MTGQHPKRKQQAEPNLAKLVGDKALNKLKGRRNRSPGIWFGLGMMGLIGWSVAIPTILGAALGLWLDQHYPDDRSWTLALIIAGLTLGCLNAWRWIAQEDQAMHDKKEEDDD